LHHFNITDIHCFEPHPILHKKTKEVYPFINMNNYCIGNMDGYIDIYIPQYSVGLSSVIKRPIFSELNQKIHTLNVVCKKLDTYCEENKIDEIDFLKIDVEGAEKQIFDGATKLLENKKIKFGIFEIGQTLYDANTHENEICELLHNYGYTIDKSISPHDYIFYL